MRLLVRLDDFTPNRDIGKWDAVAEVLDHHNIKPLVALVPNDQYFGTKQTDAVFWKHARRLVSKQWSIGLHGFSHLVEPIRTDAGREIFFAKKSEFVGLPFEEQLSKLEVAWDTCVSHGVKPVAFIAPNHGFDANTIAAIVRHGQMKFISDGVSLRLFRDRMLYWIPQIDWRVPRLPIGFRSVCLHPSTMSEQELRRFCLDVKRNIRSFICFEDIVPECIPARGFQEVLFGGIFSIYFNGKGSIYRLLSAVRAGVNGQ